MHHARDPDQSQIAHQMMAAQNRPAGRRLQSGGWSRLRPAQTDALEVYGLPSKGETRLQDLKTQETYYKKIVERYMRFCAASGTGEKLEEAFTSLSLVPDPVSRLDTIPGPKPASGAIDQDARQAELSTIIMAMRKLREAIVSSHRHDSFACSAYLFIIHATILTRSWESYTPALSYLLRSIHPVHPLSYSERNEVVGYLILDSACRQHDLLEALRLRHRYRLRDRHVDAILKALSHDDYVLFWRTRNQVDGYKRSLMSYAEDGIRLLALKCLGRAYLSADKAFIERCADKQWTALVRDKVGWELGDGDMVTIRRIKGK